MTTRLIHRPARAIRPSPPAEPVAVAPPPLLPEGKAISGIQSLIPMAGSGVAMSMMMFLRGSGFAALGAVIIVVSLTAASVFYLSQRGRATRLRRSHRERYLDHLERLRERLRGEEQELRRQAHRLDPPVTALLDVVRDPARRWERRRLDSDFLLVRVGVGALPARKLELSDQGTLTNPTDPFMRQAAQALVRRFEVVPDLPLCLPLDQAGSVSVIGERAEVLRIARAIIAQVTALHAPDDVTLAVVVRPDLAADWTWTRWLPHLLPPGQIGPAGPTPLLVACPADLCAMLSGDLAQRAAEAASCLRRPSDHPAARVRARLLVIDDAYRTVARELPLPGSWGPPQGLGITLVHLLADQLDEPDEVSCRVTAEAGSVTVVDPRATPPQAVTGTIDDVPAGLAEGLARGLSPLRLSPDSYDDGTGTAPADFASLLGLTGPAGSADPSGMDVALLWRSRSGREFLRIPLGVDPTGRPVTLDLKELAQVGMGPHGLCVGATGSGKSELLRTLVLALAVTHSPRQLSMVLVDYKGGATFAPFTDLPHVAGMITNLAADTSLVERAYTSLDGEVLRRQQVLADAGKLTDITEYAMRRVELGEPDSMPPLRHLLVLIDEFGELLAAKPEFIDLFLRIGRIGRSIGVHLLLSSQRVEQGKMRGLETYLSYRIGLRTLTEMESRTVLDTPDAFRLPPLPGHGYLKVDVTVYQRFKAAYVSGPLATEDDSLEVPDEPGRGRVAPMPLLSDPPEESSSVVEPHPTQRTTGPTLMSTMVKRLAGAAPRVPEIWLPPLPAAVTLDQAAGGFDVTEQGIRLRPGPTGRGQVTGNPESRERAEGGLAIPLGLLDDPANQWQGLWLVDLSSGGGNLLVLGGPGSGKTTALRSIALALATTLTPCDVGIYGADLLGSGLRQLSRLPHVGGIACRDDRERVRRVFDEVHALLAHRERLFARHQIDSAEELRSARAAGRLRNELPGTDVVLLIDGYGQLNAEFEPFESQVHDLLARGGRYGVHVIATARRWNEARAAQQVAFANRIELRLTEPGESSIEGKLARAVPANQPGRALTVDRRYAQVALPRLDGVPDPASSGLDDTVTLICGTWTGPLPPPVRVLPAVLPARDLPAPPVRPAAAPASPDRTVATDAERTPVPFGRFESDFAVAELDLFGRDQHLLVLGDTATGKTNLLRLLAQRLIRQYGSDRLVFAVFDPRRGLAEAIPEPYQGGYAPNAALAQQLAAAVAKELTQRDPAVGGAGIGSAADGRGVSGDRDPAGAPRIVLLVDDYDILSAARTHPMAALVPFLAAGRDVGLHVIMARRVAGASRGLYEPFTLAVRESGCLGLLMSGDRSEGPLFPGVRPAILPPGRAQYIRPGEPARTVQTAFLATNSRKGKR